MRLRVLGIILAGGKGTRLFPLTKERAKPAVPFGGKYRIVDFVLSNFINSGIHSMYVLTQFKSQSLLQHLSDGWQLGGLLKSQFVIPVPAQMRSTGETWYRGTADAIFQNVNLIEQSDPHLVAIFGADHIYRMNITSMIEFHEQKRADVTVAAIPVDRRLAHELGVLETARDGHIVAFHEKRPDAPAIPGDPARVFASMGNYVFSRARCSASSTRTRRARTAVTISAGTSSRRWSSAPPSSPTTSRPIRSPARTRARPTGATWGRSTRTTRRTWTCGP